MTRPSLAAAFVTVVFLGMEIPAVFGQQGYGSFPADPFQGGNPGAYGGYNPSRLPYGSEYGNLPTRPANPYSGAYPADPSSLYPGAAKWARIARTSRRSPITPRVGTSSACTAMSFSRLKSARRCAGFGSRPPPLERPGTRRRNLRCAVRLAARKTPSSAVGAGYGISRR